MCARVNIHFCIQFGLLLVAGAHFHVQAEDDMPVVGEVEKITLNGQGGEQYIAHPDDGESLLTQALSNDEPPEHDSERYQPTYEYDDGPGAEGQQETDGLEAVIQSERAYFVARDHDGDGDLRYVTQRNFLRAAVVNRVALTFLEYLSKKEFIRQLNDVDTDTDDWDSWNISARGRPVSADFSRFQYTYTCTYINVCEYTFICIYICVYVYMCV